MENINTKINKLLIKLVIFAIFFVNTNVAIAYTSYIYDSGPECMIRNFKANGSTSLEVRSGSPVTLSWDTANCKSVKLSGGKINTSVAQSGYLTINPTNSNKYTISGAIGNGLYNYQKIEVSVIPEVTVINTPVVTAINPVVIPTQYVLQPATTTKVATATTTKTTTNVTNTKTNTVDNTNTSDTNNSDVLSANVYNSRTNNSNIPALTLQGSGGFMPSSIWQWMLVVVLILIIVILSRLFIKKPIPYEVQVAPAK
jgi:hypothetical protein